MSIKIITDSLSDLPQNLIKEFDIEVLPLTVIFENTEYRDGIDLTSEEFYKKLKESPSIPKTSQVTPAKFEEVFKNYLQTYEQIIYISGSSRATGTYQSSVIAKDLLQNDNIYIFDTMALSFGCGIMVLKAAQMSKEGKDVQEILLELENMRNSVDHIFTVDTLEYLQKGGRISSTKAAIGTILNIKPILTVEEGLVSQLDQVRGKKKVISKMIEIVKKRSNNIQNQIIGISHADNEELLNEFKKVIKEELNPKDIIVTNIGSAIGTHAGPGTIAIFYMK
ncbi:DegV family protein [Tepidibacter hydrothermalis]|uniref:DegV family protein n=1 Tax=Tepidibacter hydrothermalis TaxID=3036126 RepID=A0ABY8E9H9_9FIRM|nr:DegV family protein [Tepidibacter hydrothermalis]WFD09547.1 DegV family protein [Tepidibacter hydrothermalis]